MRKPETESFARWQFVVNTNMQMIFGRGFKLKLRRIVRRSVIDFSLSQFERELDEHAFEPAGARNGRRKCIPDLSGACMAASEGVGGQICAIDTMFIGAAR